MAQIPNTNAFDVGDGLNTYVNVDTVNKIVQLLNGASLKLYSDAGSTLTGQLVGGVLSVAQSGTAPDPGAGGTITTSGVGVARVTPAAARTGVILQAGTVAGQLCLVINEAAVGNSITFNTTPATSNVADSATEALIPGLQSRLFIWDSGTSLWYAVGNPLANGTFVGVQSASAAAVATSGTITTSGVGVARVAPAGAVTAVVLQAGVYPGQEVTVVNEAVAANTVTFAAAGTSNVADGTGDAIAGLTARTFVWDSSTSLWYPMK